MAVYVQHLRKTAATWTSDNTVLKAGQIGVETDTLKGKFGDGTTAWNSLGYIWTVAGAGGGDFSTSFSSCVDGELIVTSGTGGKTGKRANALSGIAKLAAGVVSAVTAPSGAIVGDTDTQTLTNKTLSSGTNTFPTFNQNTSGTAANLSGTPALPNGTTATTQTAADNSTKLATTAYVDTGLGGKQPLDSDLTTIAGLTATTDNFMVAASSAWASRTPAQARTSLGLVIGTNVQAWDADLDTWATKTAPSGTVVGTTDTQTLTNKRRTLRIGTTASSATPAINTDDYDQFNITALAVAISSMTSSLTGTPTDGQKLMIRIKDNGTPRTIVWGASFVSSGVATLLALTSTSKTHMVGLIWDAAASLWVCAAVDATGY